MDFDGTVRTEIDAYKRKAVHELLDTVLDIMAVNKDYISLQFSNYGNDVNVYFERGGFSKLGYDLSESMNYKDKSFDFKNGYIAGFFKNEIDITKKEEDEDGSGESDAD